MKVDVKKLTESASFTELLAKALKPFEDNEEHKVQIQIAIRTDFNTSLCVKVNSDFDLYDYDAGEASAETEESGEGECCDASCDCKEEGDGL